MKKIILAGVLIVLGTTATIAQMGVRKPAVRTTTTTSTKAITTTNAVTPQQSTVVPADQRRDAVTPTDMQLQNSNKTVPVSSDIIVPDHAYEPKGTEGVGVYGNQTGGSSIGSSNTTNGGTLKNATDNGANNTTSPNGVKISR